MSVFHLHLRQAVRRRPAPPAARPGAAALRRVIVPSEHGAWGFLAEPLALGLLAAFSVAGVLAALAVAAAFLTRQPLKLWTADRRKGKRYPRTATAERALLALAGGSAACLAGAVALAGPRLLYPLALAAPVGAAALALDLRNRGRGWISELAAPVALTGSVAVIVLAGGGGTAAALGLWGILACRAVPSVFYVRTRLRLERGEEPSTGVAEAAQATAVAAALALAATGLAPWLGTAAVAVLAGRAFYGLSSIRKPASARQTGLRELGWGGFTVLATAAGVLLGI